MPIESSSVPIESHTMKKKSDVPSVPVYFSQRPKPGCFHAVEFGTRYCSNGPMFGAVVGVMLGIPKKFISDRITNVHAYRETEMFIIHDGTIMDIATVNGTPVVHTRPEKMTWKEQ